MLLEVAACWRRTPGLDYLREEVSFAKLLVIFTNKRPYPRASISSEERPATLISPTHCRQHGPCHYSNPQPVHDISSELRLRLQGAKKFAAPTNNGFKLLFPSTKTYHRPLKGIRIGPKLLQSLLLIRSTLDDRADSPWANISQDGLQLVGCRWALGDIELELLASPRTRLSGVVAGLIDCRRGAGVGGHLLQEGDHS